VVGLGKFKQVFTTLGRRQRVQQFLKPVGLAVVVELFGGRNEKS
jgi:hypothetical protein